MASSEDTPDQQARPAPAPPRREDRSNEASARPSRPPTTIAASAVPTLPGAEPVRSLVEEIKARVTDLTSRELELQRREEELEVRVAQLHERERQLDERERALADQQRHQDGQRAVIAQTLETLAEREASDKQRRAEIHRRLAEKLDLIRRRKNELIDKVRAVREELQRRQLGLAHDRQALDEQATALENRRTELQQQTDALDQRARAVESHAEDVDRRSNDLDHRAAELVSRTAALEQTAADLDERGNALAEQAAGLASRRTQVEHLRTELERRRGELDRRAEELAQRAAALEDMAAKLDERDNTFAEREAALADLSGQVELKEEELRRRANDLGAHAQQLDAHAQEIEARRAECDTEAEALRQRAEEVEQTQAILDARTAELDTARAQLNELARTLELRKEDLRALRTELDQDRGDVAKARSTLHQQLDQLQSRESELNALQAELTDRRQRLDDREAALSKQMAALAIRHDEVSQREAAIDEQRTAANQLHHRAAEARDRVQRQVREVATLKQRLQAREAELRHESLQTELDREQLQRERAALDEERDQLAQLHAETEREHDRIGRRGERPHPTAASPVAQPSPPPVRPWRRGLVLCGALGVAAAAVWLNVDQPRYRSYAEIRIAGARESSEQSVATHAAWLMSDALIESWQGPPPVDAWITARAERRLSARPESERPVVRVTLDSADLTLAKTMLPAAAQAYIAYVDGLPPEQFDQTHAGNWTAVLRSQLSNLRERTRGIRARLAEAPDSSARTEMQASFEEALDDLERVMRQLRTQRAALVTLQSQELPRGEVTPEARQQALADDAVYQEDLKERQAGVREYRTELAVSMVLLVDPLRELRASVQALAATTVEQRDLQPPPEVRTVLELCIAEMDDFNQFLAEFAQTWEQRRETIERLKASEQVGELFNQQQEAAEAARRLVEESRRMLGQIEARVDGLTKNGDAGTRAIVVAALLRGDLSGLTERTDAVAEVAGATDLSVNFRLDAHDRQLRALRARLRDRQQAIRQALQADADRMARAQRDEQERQLREDVGTLDQRRQELIDALVAQLQHLRQLDQEHQEAGKLNAELRAAEGVVAQLEKHLVAADSQPAQPQRDHVELADSGWEQVAGTHRGRNAALAGAAAFAAMGLLLLLMFAPRRSRGAAVRAPVSTEQRAAPTQTHNEDRGV